MKKSNSTTGITTARAAKRRLTVFSTAALFILDAPFVSAQPPHRETTVPLDEIVVTARKREETLVSAPIAVAAFSGNTLQQYNIVRMDDISSLAGGGVLIGESGITPTISIRGVSSDSTNAGFDQSVGIIIDGIFYDRSRWTSQGFFDVGQVEILKGPQALFFGKSTVAGAVVLRTADPTDTFEGKVTIGTEFETKQIYTQGYVSGPINETLSARLALRYADSDGWLTNEVPNPFKRTLGGEREKMGRLTLKWDPTSDLVATFKTQIANTKSDGFGIYAQLYNCRGPSPLGDSITGIPADLALTYGAYYPIVDNCKLDDRSSVYPGPPGTGFAASPYADFDSALASLNVTWTREKWSLTSVTGWNDYQVDDATGYISSQGNISAVQREKNRSFSQELRIMTSLEGPLNFLAGLNYQKSEFSFHNSNILLLAIPDTRNGRFESQDHVATQDTRSYSGFAEITWAIAPEWTLSAGTRYSREEKDARYHLTFVNHWFEDIFGFPFWLPEGTHIADDFRDNNTSSQVTLRWMPRSELNFFISYREGFLPGGFSLGATPQAGLTKKDFLFESEEVDGYEVGFKGIFLDNTLNVELIAYDYKFTNLQVNIYVPTTASFVVGNAGEARTQGVESSLSWRPLDMLELHGAVTYNSGEYDNYRNACYALQTSAQGCDTSTNTQDMSGKALPRAPKKTAGIGAVFTYPLDNWKLSVTTDLQWSDKYQLDSSNSPFLRQKSFARWDMTVALESADGAWRAAVIGRNITNEAIANFGATRGFTNDNLATIQALRRWGVELSYRF